MEGYIVAYVLLLVNLHIVGGAIFTLHCIIKVLYTLNVHCLHKTHNMYKVN